MAVPAKPGCGSSESHESDTRPVRCCQQIGFCTPRASALWVLGGVGFEAWVESVIKHLRIEGKIK